MAAQPTYTVSVVARLSRHDKYQGTHVSFLEKSAVLLAVTTAAFSSIAHRTAQAEGHAQATRVADAAKAFPQLQSVSPITNRIVALSFVEGVATHETPGGGGANGDVKSWPLDLVKAAQPATYSIRSKDDGSLCAVFAAAKSRAQKQGTGFLSTTITSLNG
jgi:hypothetical protein